MKFSVANIRLSELQTKQVCVVPWEIPILRAVHGDNVVVVDEQEIDREPPEAQDEYRRLAQRYSGNKDEGESVVALVYGTFAAGIDALEKEIAKAAKGGGKRAREDAPVPQSASRAAAAAVAAR